MFNPFLVPLMLAGLGAVVRHDEEVLPFVLDVVVPVPEEQAGEDACLDEVLLAFVDPLTVERIALGERAMAHVSRHYDAQTNTGRLLGLLKAEATAARAERFDALSARCA